jgi:sugar fermentation stimulation protein A
MIEMDDGLVGVNTTLPNRLAALAARAGVFPGWPKNPEITAEAKVGEARLDLRLTPRTSATGSAGPTVWVEVKNCSLVEAGVALFPDAPSQRGGRHLASLNALVEKGDRAVMLFLVQRPARAFRPAEAIDPAFAKALRAAFAGGVELLAYRVDLTLAAASLAERLEIEL